LPLVWHWDDRQRRGVAAEAVELANGADHVLVFLGLSGEDKSEDSIGPKSICNQLVLLHALAEVHDRLIVILANGGVVRVSTWGDRVKRDLPWGHTLAAFEGMALSHNELAELVAEL
jgi:hypothetical protein